MIDCDVPKFTGAIEGAVIKLALEHNSRADTFANVEKDQMLWLVTRVCAQPDFGERRQPRTVIEKDGQIEVQRIAQDRTNRNIVTPAHTVGRQHTSIICIDETDQANTDSIDAIDRRAGLQQLLDAP